MAHYHVTDDKERNIIISTLYDMLQKLFDVITTAATNNA